MNGRSFRPPSSGFRDDSALIGTIGEAAWAFIWLRELVFQWFTCFYVLWQSKRRPGAKATVFYFLPVFNDCSRTASISTSQPTALSSAPGTPGLITGSTG